MRIEARATKAPAGPQRRLLAAVSLSVAAGLMAGEVVAIPQSYRSSDGRDAASVSSGEEEPGVQQVLQLTLAEAVRLAFENNLDIQVVRYDRGMAREGVRVARGAFDPVFQVGTPGASLTAPVGGGGFGGTGAFDGLGFTSTESPTSSQLAGANVIENDTFSTAFDLGQLFEFGLRYGVSYRLTRNNTNSAFSSLNPSYDNTLTLGVAQPLLRGRGREATAAPLLLARRNAEVSAANFRAQVEAVLLEVEQAYWELVFTERNVELQEQSLRLADEQLERTNAQVEVGMLAPVQGTQAEAAVAQRQSELIVARNAADSAADRLRALLQAESLPQGWDTTIVAVEEPAVTPRPVDLQNAMADALAGRSELAQARAQIAARRVETESARNGLLPQLDLIGQLGYSGIGGDLLIRDGFFGPIIDIEEGGYDDAAGQLFDFDFPAWRIGVKFSLPIGNNTAEGSYARATLAEDRAAAELDRQEQQVVLEVRQAVRELQAAAQRIETDRIARQLAERQLEIEQDRFEVGMSTNFEVLEFQDDLARAATNELRAMIDYRLAEARLARATGTLLGGFGIQIRQ